MKAFKAYDIRGIYTEDFTRNDVYRIGYFLPELMKTEKVLIGRDARASSDEIFESLSQGIIDSGADVFNMGLATTPMVYYITAKHNFHASVQITASHNPAEYNGMKVSGTNAAPVGYENGLKKLEELVASDRPMPVAKKGHVYDYKVKDEYLRFLETYKPKHLDTLNMAIDGSNGMAGLLIKKLLGNKPHYLYADIDCSFPNHDPNPLKEENLTDLKELVKKEQCDIGVIFDGDADRVMFVDEKGNFISPDLIIALLGHYFLKDQKGIVLQDIRTSKSVKEYLAPMGGEVHTWRVGRAFAAHKLRELEGIFGGELAGHYYFRDFFYSDSGIMAALIVLELVASFKEQGKTFSEVMRQIKGYVTSGEVNFKIEQKSEAMEAVKKHFTQLEEPTEVMDFDGYRIEFPQWWFNIRPSNTEPYLRLVAEAKSKELLDKKLAELHKIIGKFQ